jgi:hypothetical protein
MDQVMTEKNAGMLWIERLCWLFFIACSAAIGWECIRRYLSGELGVH